MTLSKKQPKNSFRLFDWLVLVDQATIIDSKHYIISEYFFIKHLINPLRIVWVVYMGKKTTAYTRSHLCV